MTHSQYSRLKWALSASAAIGSSLLVIALEIQR